MKILILAKGDWSGAGFALSRAINEHTEHEAKQVAMNTYWTQYPAGILAPKPDELRALLDWADIWNLHDDADALIPVGIEWKPVVATYHGSWYRAYWQDVNRRHGRAGYVQTCLTQDLSMFGPTWIGRPMEPVWDQYRPEREWIVAHAPTKRDQKGTEQIVSGLTGLAGVVPDIIEGVPNAECLKRKARARVYIDQIGDMAIGYGTNSLEAWAYGMPVVSYAPPAIIDQIDALCGSIPFYLAKDAIGVRAAITKFRDDPHAWEWWARKGREFLSLHHDPQRIAEQFLGLCALSQRRGVAKAPRRTVSVCMIVRNEEKDLPAAVSSTQGLADEVVVCDTGSADRTVEIATSLGCHVVTGADAMHKGESRNRAIEVASGDWVVILDADERISEPARFRSFLDTTDAEAIFVRETYITDTNQQGLSFPQMRAWRKVNGKPTFLYKYRAHEIPLPTNGWKKTAHTDFIFEHRPDARKGTWKLGYTLKRILLDMGENPEDPRPVYYLGRQYRYLRQYKAAIDALARYLEMPGAERDWDRANACMDIALCYKALGDKKNQKAWLYRAAQEQPMNRQRWWEIAIWHYDEKQFELASGALMFALEIPAGKEQGYEYPNLHRADIWDKLAMCLWYQKRYREGRACVLKALEFSPDSPRLKDNLGWFDRALGVKDGDV